MTDYKSSKIIDKVGDEAKQNIQFVLSSGDIVYITLYFNLNVNYWYIDIEYNKFKIYGLQVVYSLNLLEQFSRILPFGLEVYSLSGISPYTITSFKEGINSLIINEFKDAE